MKRSAEPLQPGSAREDPRAAELRGWLDSLSHEHALAPETMRPASNDASFRRYFRIDAARADAPSRIAMDAPPPMEDCRPFVHAATVFGQAGVSVPRVLAADLERGFLLLEDFGTRTYLSQFAGGGEDTADALMRDAIAALVRAQSASRPGVFADYDRALLERELQLYPQWYVAKHRGIELDSTLADALSAAFGQLLANNLAQPRVYVHRDYHSRNLMVLEAPANPGILDFQDAVYGPITYDLVSLLRDAYVDWPEERQLDWSIRYWEAARRARLPVAADFGAFYRDFEWMGLQRHVKVLGIFARLCHRDGKSGYLDDMPRVLGYVLRTARRYGEFADLVRVVERVERGPAAEPLARAGYTF